MSIVAGVDFGTLSVRVSLFDSAQGKLGAGSAGYPLLRKKEDPDHATQSHADHMNALAAAQEAQKRLRGREPELPVVDLARYDALLGEPL